MAENGVACAGYIFCIVFGLTVQMFWNSQFFSNLNFYSPHPNVLQKGSIWGGSKNPCIGYHAAMFPIVVFV